MDFDSSSKFISSLAKFLQSLCNGYVEFDNGVEVIGHIYINVDTGKKIDYVLNEKVCKTDENSVTFISNSFHAQPAEKPKPTDKISASQSNDNESAVGSHEDEIIIMDEPESSNIGTLPLHQQQQKRPSKRSHQEKFSSSHRQQSKYSRTNPSVGQTNGSQSQNSDSLHSENSSKELAGHFPGNSIVTAATESDMSHLSSVFPQSFNDPPSSQLTDDKDIKPQLDADLNVVNVKQEYDPSQEGIEEDQEGSSTLNGELESTASAWVRGRTKDPALVSIGYSALAPTTDNTTTPASKVLRAEAVCENIETAQINLNESECADSVNDASVCVSNKRNSETSGEAHVIPLQNKKSLKFKEKCKNIKPSEVIEKLDSELTSLK
ncbi:hypothetical protein PoB_005129800 [Plakobranchus ocellatus]|uniref:Uncharacterized protein n=1 Tax=Plakobranchus ocellatus TaxID=259542 RepID=A0AAV4C129_9GAST|nr:hypothetical protein PoB_005129800 [Plakobranchus ocellatus]